MSQICIIHNALDETEQEIVQSENVLKTFLEIKAKHPQALIYRGNPCPENDITPTSEDKAGIARLLETNADCWIVCYPGETSTIVTWVATKLLGAAIQSFVKIPKMNNGTSTGSSNNNLSNPENKQQIS